MGGYMLKRCFQVMKYGVQYVLSNQTSQKLNPLRIGVNNFYQDIQHPPSCPGPTLS